MRRSYERRASGLYLPGTGPILPPVRGGAPDSLTIYPSAATYIAEANPTTNYGSNANLIVKRTTGSKLGEDKYATLIYCDLLAEGVPPGVTIASTSRLRLYVTSIYGYGDTEQCLWHRGSYAPISFPWDESVVYWNHLTGFRGDPYFGFGYPTTTGWFEVTGADVAEVLQFALDSGHEQGSAGDLDICLFPGTTNELVGFICDSDDGTHPPELILDWGAAAARRIFII